MIRLTTRRGGVALLAIACLTGMAACSSTSSSTTSGTATASAGAVKSGGTLTYALDEDLAGFNQLQADDAEFVLAEIQDQVWPSVYIAQPNVSLALDTNVVTSATVTNTSPQTIVYHINPKATWSDGTPISAQDFIYNWQAQSGNPAYKDVGGKAFLPASTAGYSSIKSVTSSDNGKTATVVFTTPFGDWQALFSPMIPAHIASKVGFNDGFQNFGPAVQVSGGPYEIQSYSKGESLVEVPNPHYWGVAGKLGKIVFRFILDDTQIPPAMQNGEVNLANPIAATVAFKDGVESIPNTTTTVIPGLEFQHMDFNQANPYLALANVRHAIAYGTNRAQMIQRIVGPITTKIGVLQNRIYMPIQPQFTDTSGGYGAFNPSMAKTLLTQSNMTMGSDGYFRPNFGPLAGKDLTLSISTTTGNAVRAEIEQLFQADMKAIGIKINIQNYNANTLFGTVGPKSEYDIIQFAWVATPFASSNQPIYCSYTNSSLCGENWNHYANKQVDSLFTQALATTNDHQAAVLYNQIDGILWKDMVTLPLFEAPQLYSWTNTYGNIIPNPTSIGVPWNAQLWGLKAA
jgi:peptide/nickel transport system substrate-binding protein